MDRLYKTYGRLLAETDLGFTRYLYEKINWDNRLIVIKGAKGVGKTTMLLQHILRTFDDKQKALYASLDHIWFANHSVLDLAEYHYTHGGTHLFLDEVHKYKRMAAGSQEYLRFLSTIAHCLDGVIDAKVGGVVGGRPLTPPSSVHA